MIEDSSRARGRPKGIMFAVAQTTSSAMVKNSRPLPVSSSIYRHTKFIIRMKSTMKNVAASGPMYALITRRCTRVIIIAMMISAMAIHMGMVIAPHDQSMRS